MRRIIFIIALVLVAIISHSEWFSYHTILANGDWGYWFPETFGNYLNVYGTWIPYLDFGLVNIQVYFTIFYSVWVFLNILGVDPYISTKLTMFVPIAILGFLSPYFLSNKLTGDRYIAFIAALFYGSTSYFLSIQMGHLPIAFVYALSPLIFLAFIYALEKNRLYAWLIFSLLYSIGIGYELRIIYILSFILLFYFLYFYARKIKSFIKYFIFSGFVILLLNVYWLLPTIFGRTASSVSAIAGRGLFGEKLVDIMRGFTLSHWAWTGGYPGTDFNPEPILTYFWILPLFIFSLFLIKNNPYLKKMLFYLILLLVGIFLVKQNNPPFDWFYSSMRDYFPGFILFRESSKFYIVVALSYLALLSYGLVLVKKKSIKIFYLISALFIILSLLNLKPLITKEYRGLFVERVIPNDYVALKDKILNENESYRFLWVPRDSRWGFFSTKNPKISMINVEQGDWNSFAGIQDDDTSYGELMKDIFEHKYADNLLDNSSIKYVGVIHQDKTDFEDRLFKFYGENRNFYIKMLNSQNYLKPSSMKYDDIDVFLNEDYKPRIYVTDEKETIESKIPYKSVDFKIESPTQYSVNIGNIDKPFYLNFSETYSPNWKVRIGDFSWLKAVYENNYFLSNDDHFKNDANLNSYYIDPLTVCEVYKCIKNSNNQYSFNLKIYFLPNSYLLLGVFISLFSVGIILFYLAIYFLRNREKI